MRKFLSVGVTASLFLCAPVSKTNAQEKDPLRLVQTIPMPNVKGRIDHMDVDVKGKRLFVAGLENGSVEVIDLGAGKWSRSIPGFKKTQGIAYIPSLNKLFVASGDDGMLRVFRGDSLELLDSIKLELGPNRVAYDPHKSILYVGYGGKDAGKDYGEIGIIDAKTDRHVGDHRLFTITRKTPMMVVLDTQSGKEVARLRAAGECDDVFFDAGRKRIYVIGGEGIISVFQQNDPDHYELVANVPSSVGIRTGYYFAKRDRFYVAVPAKGNEPAQVWTFEAED